MAVVESHGRGAALVNLLGLNQLGREGHDIKLACINCPSSDAMRVHCESGVGYCHSCTAKWSPYQLAAQCLGNGVAAFKTLVSVGLAEPVGRANDANTSAPTGALELIAKEKAVSVRGLTAYGAKEHQGAVVIPMIGPDGNWCSTFTLKPGGGKGINQRGKPTGLFLPRDQDPELTKPKPKKPQNGENWLFVEGVKDAAALHDLGHLAVGLPSSALPERFVKLFAGIDVTLVPDRDRAGFAGANKSAGLLFGHAASIKIATLPAEFRPSKGDDVRDVLKRPGGRELVLQAIAEAKKWEPANQDTGGEGTPSDASSFSNFKLEVDDAGKSKKIPMTMVEIRNRLEELTDTQIKRVGQQLFIHDLHGVCWLNKPPALFGWLSTFVGQVEWAAGVGLVSREELFAELCRTVPQFDAVEEFPHFAEMPRHYYAHAPIAPGDGKYLDQLLERFNPETQLDADLLRAAFVTPFWGGPSGARPAIAITSQHGRGAGKSALANAIGSLVGGVFELSLDEQIDTVKKRLLTQDAATKRVVLLDNVKRSRLSHGDFEGLITAGSISGHRLYVGECARPNTLTWLLTINGPAMSKDFAQRCLILKLAKPVYSPIWQEDTFAFITKHRLEITADIAAFFTTQPLELAKCSRWGAWERSVLARLPEPEELQTLIAERQAEVNADDEEVLEIEDHFRMRLSGLGYDPVAESVHIPNVLAAEWYGEAVNNRVSPTAMTRAVNQASEEGAMRHLRPNPCRKHGRGLLWQGISQRVAYDIENKQHDARWQQDNRHWDR